MLLRAVAQGEAAARRGRACGARKWRKERRGARGLDGEAQGSGARRGEAQGEQWRKAVALGVWMELLWERGKGGKGVWMPWENNFSKIKINLQWPEPL
jgi:hypothetical protein